MTPTAWHVRTLASALFLTSSAASDAAEVPLESKKFVSWLTRSPVREAVDATFCTSQPFSMANLSLYSDTSKTELAERLERMKAAGRNLAKKNEMYLARGIGMTTAALGGALAAATHHVSVKTFAPKIADKVPWGVAALVDISALVFEGDTVIGHAIGAFGHGWSGYLAGKATEKILP